MPGKPYYDVTFVGRLYPVYVGGGPIYPPIGSPPVPPIFPVDPGYSPPWARPPVDPGYSPPWARPPVDPGYSPPWARPPVDPGYFPPGVGPGLPGGPTDPGYFPPGVGPGLPGGPVDPGYSPPWARPLPPHIWGGPILPGDPSWGGGPVDPGYSPPWARPKPPVIWPGPGPLPPLGGPGQPGYPVDPGYSPPWATIPVDPGYSPPWAQAPSGPPPIYQPAPPDLIPPVPPTTTTLPDFNSPGFVCLVFVGGTYTRGWVQTAIDQSDGHVPKPPTTGLPGQWITVILMTGGGVATYAWIPSPPTEAPPSPPSTPTHASVSKPQMK